MAFDYTEELTNDHIVAGIPKSSMRCAVALFLTDREELLVTVTTSGAWFEEGCHGEHKRGKKIASFDKKLRAFIRQFDRGEDCKPQTIGIKIGPRGGVTMDIVD